MARNRHIILFMLIVFSFGLTGCASIMSFLHGIETYLSSSIDDNSTGFDAEMFNEIRGSEVRKGASAARSGGYGWVPPVVQKVKVPAMIRGGVFIPAHETYVIVTDGAFVTNDAKTESVRKKYRLPAEAGIVSPLKGDDVVMAVYRLSDKAFNQSKVVELTKISFLLDSKAIDHILSLHNDEIARVGDYLCSFSREKDDDEVVAYISEGGLKQIKLFKIGKGQMLVLGNGYVLAPVFERKKGGIS